MSSIPFKEIIEQAAHAAGLPVDGWLHSAYNAMRLVDSDREFVAPWNPVTMDGDTLRLEVSLGFNILVATDGVEVSNAEGLAWYEAYADHNGDKLLARRLATTILAATIGSTDFVLPFSYTLSATAGNKKTIRISTK